MSNASTVSAAPEAGHAWVQTCRDGEVWVVTIDHPPVNALNQAVRAGLLAALQSASADPTLQAVLLVGAGQAFIAGADIRELGQTPVAPYLPDVCNAIEACPKLVVAALQGPALGGGLEVAMAAHYRVALPNATLGLPEVLLGLLPGAGGTQRTPRLMGVEAAAQLMLSGKSMTAAAAQAAGLVDAVVDSDDVRAAGLIYTRQLLARQAPLRRTRELPVTGPAAALETLERLSIETTRTAKGLFSPLQIIDCLRAAVHLPFDDGLKHERARYLECLASPQRSGLVHAFLAEREVAKVPEAQAAAPRTVAHVGVVGGGTMGAGIAVALLQAGLQVTMVERDAEAIARGQANVTQVVDGMVAKGRMTNAARHALLARLAPTTDYAALSAVDLVIEAVFEDLAVKQAVFRQLDAVCRPGAVLATNTSYLDIDAIAAVTRRPQDVIGLHFFSPAHVMRLLEIVVPQAVAPDVVATAFALAKRLKKVPVRAGVCDGFIGNRILAAYKQVADYLMADGASPYEIDAAMRQFGFAMGPFQVVDLAGGDIGWAARQRRAATRDARLRYVAIADRLCERGWFGQKTGRGFYRYPEGSRTGQPDPDVLAIVEAERAHMGITPRHFDADAIIARCLAAIVNEGAKVVGEGIALRPLDVDVTLVAGYGFPRHRGGPMHWADMVGLDRVLADVRRFAQDDPWFWQPAPLLEQLVAQGRNFASLNAAAQPQAQPEMEKA